jgi:hypothetical protein
MATRSLDERVTALEEIVAGLQNLPNELAEFRRETNERFEQIDARFEQMDDRFSRVERLISEESERLYARMRMLHEEVINRIRTGSEGPANGDSDTPRRSRRHPKR